jgi:hypothetical protein
LFETIAAIFKAEAAEEVDVEVGGLFVEAI